MIGLTTYPMWAADPFSEVRRLQREMNRVFRDFSSDGAEAVFPAVNIHATRDVVTVTAEVPGLEAKDIQVTLVGDQLTIEGERKADAPAEGVACHRNERATGKFVRTFRLPFEADAAQVTATARNGILSVVLPRAEASKPRQIAVKAE